MTRTTLAAAICLLAAHAAPARAEEAAVPIEDPAAPVATPVAPTPTVAQATAPTSATHNITVAALLGSSIPINGVNYFAGIGVRGGIHFGHIYVGAMLAVHQGDSKSIDWGATATQPSGTQTYSSMPIVTAVDVGYRIDIPLGRIVASLLPYLSTGVIATTMSSSGVYGESSIVNTDFVIGGGLGVSVPIGHRLAIGLHSRTYNVGDTSFHFGDSSQGTYEHGFSTSIFYTAFYSELAMSF